MNKTASVPLLLLLVIAFTNLTLWLYVNKESRFRDNHVTRPNETRDNDIQDRLPLLLLFTSFTREQGKAYIQTNTLRNWALFRPIVQPLLYTVYEDGALVEFAKRLGWYVLPVPNMSSIGVPYLKNMYLTAMETHSSVLYGYTNGDILFSDGFVDTLREVVKHIYALNTTLIVGMRTNYNMNLDNSMPVYHLNDVNNISRKGRLFRSDAEDYFFVTNDFPWQVIPDLVIGRVAYDNFLVGTAIKQNVSVVDATKTITALHQTGVDGNLAGRRRHDTKYNANLIAKVVGKFNYFTGTTSSAQYESERDFIGNVFIQKRPPKPKKSPSNRVKPKKVNKVPKTEKGQRTN